MPSAKEEAFRWEEQEEDYNQEFSHLHQAQPEEQKQKLQIKKKSNGNVIAHKVRKKDWSWNLSIWVPKEVITNMKGPQMVWVPKET